jgi:GT2 family glycosyltransferase
MSYIGMKSEKENLIATVIVLNWNGSAHLSICLSALINQSRQDFEILVVDNASNDRSVVLVREEFPQVQLLELKENRGFSGGNNAGLAVAKGKYIILLNNDTCADPDFVKRMVECAELHPEAGFFAAHLIDWTRKFTDSAGDGCRVTGRGYARNRGHPIQYAPAAGLCFGACAGAALYRRELILDVGFLDEDFFLNFEDTDLSFRAHALGWQAWFCSDALVQHRGSASQGIWSSWNVYYGARNHIWVCAKNLPTISLFKYGFLIFAEIVALGMITVRHGKVKDYLHGILAGICGIRQQLPKRKLIQSRRRIGRRELEGGLSADYTRRLLRSWRWNRREVT